MRSLLGVVHARLGAGAVFSAVCAADPHRARLPRNVLTPFLAGAVAISRRTVIRAMTLRFHHEKRVLPAGHTHLVVLATMATVPL
jgi:hypothetical protein